MSLLIDTHALLWWLTADARLTLTAKSAIENPDIDRYISSVSAFEIAIKVRIGKLDFAKEIVEDFEQITIAGAFKSLDLTTQHALLAGEMAGLHKDPFDRLLAAQCKLENLPLVSIDPAFIQFGLELIW